MTKKLERPIIFNVLTSDIDSLLEAALREDLPEGDITSESIIPSESVSEAIILVKEEGVVAGLEIAERVFKKIDSSVFFEKLVEDGAAVGKGEHLAHLEGNSISILKGERIALNFLQRLSGIATSTRKYVKAVEGTRTRILDTRKTTPGLRLLEKYAVKMGGGENHRFSLSDMVLIKENHVRILGSVFQAIKKAREKVKPGIKIEAEATSLEQVKEAVESGADMVMLDNMPVRMIKEAVECVKGRVPLEASGSLDLNKAKKIASLGVDYISVGSLTHSFKSLDISLEFLT